jgi:hypothetical protein
MLRLRLSHTTLRCSNGNHSHLHSNTRRRLNSDRLNLLPNNINKFSRRNSVNHSLLHSYFNKHRNKPKLRLPRRLSSDLRSLNLNQLHLNQLHLSHLDLNHSSPIINSGNIETLLVEAMGLKSVSSTSRRYLHFDL